MTIVTVTGEERFERLFEMFCAHILQTNLAKRSGSVNDIGIHHEYEILIEHQMYLSHKYMFHIKL